MEQRPLLLVTNDDGITAPGIQHLIDSVKDFGELLIVAPDKPQSGMGHAITVNVPLYLNPSDCHEGHKAYSSSGTPVDCVKLAMHLLKGRKPDLIVSGINHGSNASTNVLYSGTMAAAIEGCLDGVPAIGFSLSDFSQEANFEGATMAVKAIVKAALDNNMPNDVCLNVNIPKVPANQIKGYRVCRQAKAFWTDGFEERETPFGRKYYWLTGEFENNDTEEDTDVWALRNNFVSIVPTQFDMTANQAIVEVKNWEISC